MAIEAHFVCLILLPLVASFGALRRYSLAVARVIRSLRSHYLIAFCFDFNRSYIVVEFDSQVFQ